LFEPMEEGTEAKDEWRESGRFVDPAAIAIGAVIPIAAASLWFWKRRSGKDREQELEIENVS
jgi:hypothetical protein